MEQKMSITQKVNFVEELMHQKVDCIAEHISNGRVDCAMIELGALNEYIRMQSNNVIASMPNNML